MHVKFQETRVTGWQTVNGTVLPLCLFSARLLKSSSGSKRIFESQRLSRHKKRREEGREGEREGGMEERKERGDRRGPYQIWQNPSLVQFPQQPRDGGMSIARPGAPESGVLIPR